MCQLTLPHDRSHLTFLHEGLSPKNHSVQILEFFKKIAETGTSLRLHGLRGNPVKAAVRRAVKPKNAATCQTAAVTPLCEFGSPAACARSLENAAAA